MAGLTPGPEDAKQQHEGAGELAGSTHDPKAIAGTRGRTGNNRRPHRQPAAKPEAAGLAVAVAIGLSIAASAGINAGGSVGKSTAGLHSGPPRYYIQQNYQAGGQVLQVRNTRSGRVTGTIHDPLPGSHCANENVGVAAADNQTFFMNCEIWRTANNGPIKTYIYRFQVTSSGRVTGYSLVKGGVFNGIASTIAAAPDGSEIAAQVIQPRGRKLYTNSAPNGILVINTRTGAHTLWGAGPYVPGAVQFANASDISFTQDGRELVVLEAWCHRGPHQVYCNGNAKMQVRAYSPASRGGSLAGGQVLLNESVLKPHRTRLSDAFIAPDGSSLTVNMSLCPPHGACTLTVARVQPLTGHVLQVLYQTHTGSRFQGYFERFFSWDPSGRFLILDAGQGRARVNGWIHHGRLVPLTPADGNAPNYETW